MISVLLIAMFTLDTPWALIKLPVLLCAVAVELIALTVKCIAAVVGFTGDFVVRH